MIRGVVFDLFDTLVDQNHAQLAPVLVEGRKLGATTTSLHACAQTQFGVDHSVLEFAQRLGEVDQRLRAETIDQGLELPTLVRFSAFGEGLGLADPQAFGVAMTQIHMGILAQASSTPPHHESVLMALSSDYSLALCSNFSHSETARSILGEAGLTPHFSAIVISDELGFRKPRPEIFEHMASTLDLSPHEILHVGDNLDADISGAAALGMKTVWVTRCVRDPERALKAHNGPAPDFALDDLLDLPVLLARMSVQSR